MRDLIIYVILAAIGYFIGSKLRHKKEKLAWTGKFQTVAIVLLVLTMGSRMGANDRKHRCVFACSNSGHTRIFNYSCIPC